MSKAMAKLLEDDGCFKTLAPLLGMDPSFDLMEYFSLVSANSTSQSGDLAENDFSLPLQLQHFPSSPAGCPSKVLCASVDKKKENNIKRKEKKGRRLAEEKPDGVVHVRAKRGQATDRHSLAERVRREKINEKMKHLRDLVPGCYKEMGTTLMLDEIIKYVRSLQNQVEFLSTKISAAAPYFDFNISPIDLAHWVDRDAHFQVHDMNMNGPVMKEYQDFGCAGPEIPF